MHEKRVTSCHCYVYINLFLSTSIEVKVYHKRRYWTITESKRFVCCRVFFSDGQSCSSLTLHQNHDVPKFWCRYHH
ncbi:hypothetical protein WN944_005355 [Citrus x changshan-huyou]|uniref:Uncharacterized protein n=1 Tax=Citrus x changshan-huyou TaxID=2935761 RepID=A0AAP0M315_9ROSI